MSTSGPAVTTRYRFETAHRLPHLPGKCVSLHGHSWRAAVTVAADALGGDGTVVEFGQLKAGLDAWIKTNLDHATMLDTTDPLVPLLREHGCRVYPFNDPDPLGLYRHGRGLAWPTVENVARLLARVAGEVLAGLPVVAAGARVVEVRVMETHRNEATWTP